MIPARVVLPPVASKRLRDGHKRMLDGRKREIVFVIVLFIFFVLTISVHGKPSLFPVGTLAFGEATPFYIVGDEPIDDVSVSVFGINDVRICRSIGFPVNERTNAYAAIVALPSFTVESTVLVRVRYSSSSKAGEFSERLPVEKREFLTEEIKLSGAMTDLRRSDDELIRVQAEKMWKLLNSTNRDAVFHRGTFTFPIAEIRRTSFFGDRRVYRYSDGSTARSIHNGVDYGAKTGTEVYSVGVGRIAVATERIMTGNTVVIEHLPGVYSLYYHLDSIDVEPKQIVKTGDYIGRVGATGLVTGPHLHWELRVSGVAVNPELFLTKGLLDKWDVYCNIER